jgi:hypothetical protein
MLHPLYANRNNKAFYQRQRSDERIDEGGPISLFAKRRISACSDTGEATNRVRAIVVAPLSFAKFIAISVLL